MPNDKHVIRLRISLIHVSVAVVRWPIPSDKVEDNDAAELTDPGFPDFRNEIRLLQKKKKIAPGQREIYN